MRDANRGDAAGWKALVAALRRQDTISSTETTVLVKQLTAVSPDYALRRLQREGVLQRLDPRGRGLYVVVGGKAGAFIADPIEAVQAVCGRGQGD